MKVAILVGNPSPNSRTRQLAEAVADAIAPLAGETERMVIDLADHAADLFDWKNAAVAALNAEVAASDIVVVATPTYKASYAGLLKAFLDRYDTNGLARVVAVPVMTGGSPAHSLAPDASLRLLLVELGASVPTRSLYFMTSQMDDMTNVVGAWAQANRFALLGAAHGQALRTESEGLRR